MLQGNDLEQVLRQVTTLNMNIIGDLTKVDFRNGLSFD